MFLALAILLPVLVVSGALVYWRLRVAKSPKRSSMPRNPFLISVPEEVQREIEEEDARDASNPVKEFPTRL